MRKNTVRGTLTAMIAIGLLAFAASCSTDETARVTVYFGQNLQGYHEGKEGFLDRIFNAFFARAYAFIPPEWNEAYDSLVLAITGPELDPVLVTVPPGVSSYTIELTPGEG